MTHFKPTSGKRDELTQKLETLSEKVRSVEGCFGAQVCAIRESPDLVGIVSRWASQDALDKMRSSGIVSMAEVSELLAEPAKTEHFEPF